MINIALPGCRIQPLASYLKALGIFRLLSTQRDPEATLCWQEDQAVVSTSLTEEALLQWFLEEYQPTPITSPWNGGSGYFPNDKSARKALERIEADASSRLEPYRQTLKECRQALDRLGLQDKPEPNEAKPKLIRLLRSRLSVPVALEWLDAACVVREQGIDMVPLLGTGGNDGRLDFSSNYAQNLVDLLLCAPKKRPAVAALLRQALFDTPCKGLENTAIGQYYPGAAGGPNTSSGFAGNPNVNPWDFVLALEGTLVFSAAATRRLGDDSQGFSLPFTVDPSMGGHSAVADQEGDKARCEMWLPIWPRPIHWLELRAVFAEGRAQVGGRQAASGVDFARAVASLGVERGFEGFERYTFMVRNGKNYFASPAGRYRTHDSHREVDLLSDLDPWLRSARRKLENHGGATGQRLFRQLDDAMLNLCKKPESGGLLTILKILGTIQRQLARMPKLHQKSQPEYYVRPIPRLRADWWPGRLDSSELRLAAGLRGLRQVGRFVLPIERNDWRDESRDAVWNRDSLSANLVRLLKRRFLYQPTRAGQPLTGAKLQAWRFSSRTDRAVEGRDLEAFLYGKLDEALLESYFHALLLVEIPQRLEEKPDSFAFSNLPAAYKKLKVAHSGLHPHGDEEGWVCPRTILERLSAGQTYSAFQECDRFLIGKSCPPLWRGELTSLEPLRLAAALAFPVSWGPFQSLCKQVFPPRDEMKEPAHVD